MDLILNHVKSIYNEECKFKEDASDLLAQLCIRHPIDTRLSFCVHEIFKYRAYAHLLAMNKEIVQ